MMMRDGSKRACQARQARAMTASSSWTADIGEPAALLQLAQIDRRVQRAERSGLAIARQLDGRRVGVDTLGRLVHSDRGQLARRERGHEASALDA